MCGISGIVSSSINFDERLLWVKQMSEIMHHRGPDSTGFFNDVHVSFGHNRLALLDLNERSNQPFEDEAHVLIYNGEIYNFKELRQNLTLKFKIDFKTTSDTEVLFYALKHMGIKETLKSIKGMFAFAFYDKSTKTIVIARDRIGIKPLFYAISEKSLFFSSEIKALSRCCGFDKINKYLLLQSPFGVFELSRVATAFEAVYQVEPGTYLEFKLEAATVHISTYFSTADWVEESYWNELNRKNQHEITERFETLFTAAINSMIVADAPMGAFVSGGIDSSINACIAHKSRKLNLYTANIIGKYSEFEDAKLLARHLDTDLKSYDFQPDMFLRDWVKSTWFYESPIVVHTNAVPFQNVSRMAFENKDKAVITGEGSDELFLGYPRLLTRRYDSLIKLPFILTETIYKRIPGLTRYLNLGKKNYGEDINKQVLSYEKQKLEETYKNAYAFLARDSSFKDQLLTPSMVDNGLHSLLWRNDRMGMMHSIESRFPFLDEAVMKFAMNLPVKFKIGKTNKFYNWKHPYLMDKAVVRKLGEKYLPQKLANKKKEGFPMYGHLFTKIDTGFFLAGFWQSVLGMNNEAVALMCREADPYLLAKLASVEIWGSLFSLNQSPEFVQGRVNQYIKMKI